MENISKRANENLSNYVGDEENLVSISGKKDGEQFKVTVKNNGLVGKKVALFPATAVDAAGFEALTGIAVDGVITEAIADVVVTGNPSSVSNFIEFCKRNPVNIKKMNMLVTDPQQFEQDLEVREGLSPFNAPPSRFITPSNYKTNTQNDDKLVHIEGEKLQFNDQTGVVVEFLPGTTTITFYVDSILNTSAILDNRVKRREAARTYEGM